MTTMPSLADIHALARTRGFHDANHCCQVIRGCSIGSDAALWAVWQYCLSPRPLYPQA